MDKHPLYPQLVKLAGKKLGRIMAANTTIYGALRQACGWTPPALRCTEAYKMFTQLSQPIQRTSEGYYLQFHVSHEQCWPGYQRDFAAAGIVATAAPGAITLHYAYLPDIKITLPNVLNLPFKRGTLPGFGQAKAEFIIDELWKKLVDNHGTPYQEEVAHMRLIADILPGPVAEAITDCIRAIIERRFIRVTWIATRYCSLDAVAGELMYTAYPETPSDPDKLARKMTDRRHWEQALTTCVYETDVNSDAEDDRCGGRDCDGCLECDYDHGYDYGSD